MKVKLLKKLRKEAECKYRLKKNVVNGIEQYSVVQIEYDAEWGYEQRLFDSLRYDTSVKVLEKYRSQYIRRRIEILRYGKTGIFLDV